MAEKKKFVITPFRPNVQMNSEAAKGIWRALKDAIVEIHGKNASSLSFEELYRNAYNLVLHKHGELLYAGVTESVTEHLRANAARVSSKPDDQLLAELTAQWDDHKITMVMIRDILMYMDRTYVMQRKKKPVYDLGLQIFLEQIARHADVKDRLRELLLRNIHSERTGEVVDRSQLKNILSMSWACSPSACTSRTLRGASSRPQRTFIGTSRRTSSHRTRAPSTCARRRRACRRSSSAWHTI